MFLLPPYFDHDAFMHQMHLGQNRGKQKTAFMHHALHRTRTGCPCISVSYD